jgi:hypothetical protein
VETNKAAYSGDFSRDSYSYVAFDSGLLWDMAPYFPLALAAINVATPLTS